MRLRFGFLLVALVGVLAAPVASAKHSDAAVVASAEGAYRWTIPETDIFGIEIENAMWFNARRFADGSVTGRFFYVQRAEGETFAFGIDVTCFGTPASNRAKIGGLVTYSNDPTIPVGRFGWFQIFDNGHGQTGTPDRSSLVGFGDEAANEAFCASPNLPRFGPWDVQGALNVRT